MEALYNRLYKVRYLIPLIFLWIIISVQFLMTGDYFPLYKSQVMGHFLLLLVLIRQYYYRKKKFELEMLILLGLSLAMVDMISRHYLPPIIYEINNSIIFLCVLPFMHGRLKISFKKNMSFLIGYSVFYILLSFKALNFNTMDIFPASIISIIFTVILSIVFAYSLLSTSKTKNFYHCTYCCATSLICVIVLGKRISHSHTDAFFIVQGICSISTFISICYWFEGNYFYADKFNPREFLNIQLLPNIFAGILFLLYLFKIDLDDIMFVWGLFGIILAWYFISIVSGFMTLSTSKNDAEVYEGLTPNQLDRVARYAKHLKHANYLKK